MTLVGTEDDTGSSSPLRHEEDQEVQRTHKDYLPSLKSPPEERTWGKKCLFFVKVTFAEI